MTDIEYIKEKLKKQEEINDLLIKNITEIVKNGSIQIENNILKDKTIKLLIQRIDLLEKEVVKCQTLNTSKKGMLSNFLGLMKR